MRRVRLAICLVAVCMMAVANGASADMVRGINMDFVTIGNAGNSDDVKYDVENYGAVGYNYRIGKYEVTNAQFDAYSAAVGVSSNAAWLGPDRPANMVTWYEAAQFCNYLTSGSKDFGAYQIGTGGIDRAAALSAYGKIYVLPTTDEWYKAAFYKPDDSGYSYYANGTDIAPVAGVNSNYGNLRPLQGPWSVYGGSEEQNGTFNMMGNVWEWNETPAIPPNHIEMGGSYLDVAWYLYMVSTNDPPNHTGGYIGFRVAEIGVVPEPATIFLLTLGSLALRRRK